MIIGLTGGIASGKSTVSGLLAQLGALLIDADQIAREVVLPGSPAWLEIKQTFGDDVIAEDGSLDRKKLGSLVFRDRDLRRKLEAITHPRIRSRMKERMYELNEAHPEKLIVVDIPLLYESQLQSWFEEVLLVYVPESVQLARLMQRDQLTEAEAAARLQAQMPIEEKRQLADWIINNSGTREQTKEQVLEFWRRKGLAME